MRNQTNRLAKVSSRLTPTQAVVAWMQDAHRYPTMVAYTDTLLANGDHAFPLGRLPDQVEQATRTALRGQPPDQVARAVQQALRDTCFLYHLHQQTNALLLSREELLAVRLQWLSESSQHLLVYEVLTCEREPRRRKSQTTSPALDLPEWATQRGHAERTGSWCIQALVLLGQLYTLRAVVDQLAERYFAGHAVLYPASADELASVLKGTEALVVLFNEGVASQDTTMSAEEREAIAPEIDLAAVRARQQATTALILGGIVDRAKVLALEEVGEARAAHELIVRRLQARKAPTERC